MEYTFGGPSSFLKTSSRFLRLVLLLLALNGKPVINTRESGQEKRCLFWLFWWLLRLIALLFTASQFEKHERLDQRNVLVSLRDSGVFAISSAAIASGLRARLRVVQELRIHLEVSHGGSELGVLPVLTSGVSFKLIIPAKQISPSSSAMPCTEGKATSTMSSSTMLWSDTSEYCARFALRTIRMSYSKDKSIQ